jgi:hypothetical protein
VSKSLRLAFAATVYGCGAGVAGGVCGGLTCWPFAYICGIFGGLVGAVSGIAACLIKSDQLTWAGILGFTSGMLAGAALGIYACLYAPL